MKITAYATENGKTLWRSEFDWPPTGIELIELDYSTPTTYVLGTDDHALLKSSELDTIVHVENGKPFTKEEFWFAVARLRRGGKPHRIICPKDSIAASWWKEATEKDGNQ